MTDLEGGELMTTKSSLSDALNSIGGREAFARQYQQYSGSVHFIDRDRSKLLSKYNDNWVAVYNSKVVAHGKTYHDVVKDIKQKKLPIGEVAVKFLSSRKRITLF